MRKIPLNLIFFHSSEISTVWIRTNFLGSEYYELEMSNKYQISIELIGQDNSQTSGKKIGQEQFSNLWKKIQF